jgi:hypothetical protein
LDITDGNVTSVSEALHYHLLNNLQSISTLNQPGVLVLHIQRICEVAPQVFLKRKQYIAFDFEITFHKQKYVLSSIISHSGQFMSEDCYNVFVNNRNGAMNGWFHIVNHVSTFITVDKLVEKCKSVCMLFYRLKFDQKHVYSLTSVVKRFNNSDGFDDMGCDDLASPQAKQIYPPTPKSTNLKFDVDVPLKKTSGKLQFTCLLLKFIFL